MVGGLNCRLCTCSGCKIHVPTVQINFLGFSASLLKNQLKQFITCEGTAHQQILDTGWVLVLLPPFINPKLSLGGALQGSALLCEPGPFLLPCPSVRGAAPARCGMSSCCPRAALSCPGGDLTAPGPQEEDKVFLWRCQHQKSPRAGFQQGGGRGREGDWERSVLRVGKCWTLLAGHKGLGAGTVLRTGFVLVLPSSPRTQRKMLGGKFLSTFPAQSKILLPLLRGL